MSPSSEPLAPPAGAAGRSGPGLWSARVPGWRLDRVAVGLFPGRLLLARAAGGWRRPPILRQEEFPLPAAPAGAPAWQPALEALAARIGDGSLAGARVSLVLSSHFVHYALVPWSPLLRSEQEQEAYARERFVRIHGQPAQAWALRLSRSGAGQSRVACAVAPALGAAVAQLMAPLGRRYVSLQPHLMASFNRCHQQLDSRPRWLAVQEPGLLCLALLQGGQWHSVRAMKLRGPGSGPLAELLQRERQLGESGQESDQVALLAGDAPAAAALAGGPWTLEDLRGAGSRRPRSADAAALAAILGA